MPQAYRSAAGQKPHGANRPPSGKRRANAIERAQGLQWVDRKTKRGRNQPELEEPEPELELELEPELEAEPEPEPELEPTPDAVDLNNVESHVCGGCHKSFGDARVLLIHERKHCVVLCRFECVDCGAVFKLLEMSSCGDKVTGRRQAATSANN